MKAGFKIWDKIRNKFIEEPSEEGLFLASNGNLIDVKDVSRFLAENYVVLFYAGIKDKNKKEIYEGDIVRLHEYENVKEEIVFVNGKFTVKGQFFFNPLKSEVIGNIYEQSSLLNGG